MTKEDGTSEFLERISTVEGAQEAITEALTDIHARRKLDKDGFETRYSDFKEAEKGLIFTLMNLPSDVACVSVTTRFPRVKGEPKKPAEYILFELQWQLDRVDSALQTQDEVDFEFVVLPPFVPDELKTLHHGSRVRELTTSVVKTLMPWYDRGVNYLEIKPYGTVSGVAAAALGYQDAIPFVVPWLHVETITLHRERKSLTPFLERIDRSWDNIQKVPVEYTQ